MNLRPLSISNSPRRLFTMLAAAGLALLVGARAGAAPGQRKEKGDRETKASSTVLAEDRGKFRILLDGQPVGNEDFQISSSGAEWVARGKTEINLPGQGSAQINGQLRLGLDGTPLHYEVHTQAGKKEGVTVTFQQGTASMVLQSEGASPISQDLSFNSPRVVVLDHNLYHQYAILARLYDWKARGAQSFPVLIPQAQIPGTITVEAKGPQAVEGKKLELLRVESPDLEIDLYLDGLRLMRITVASSKVEIIREESK